MFFWLRRKRKELAERDGVQVYTVMTNEQLAEMVRLRVTQPEDLRKIEEIGALRIDTYGTEFVTILAEGDGVKACNGQKGETDC